MLAPLNQPILTFLPLSPMARPERLGPYQIDETLGKGGMGQVYAATHAETGERVAIKALSPELAMAEGFRERFQAEIDSLRLLRHDGIVDLYGYGEDNGTHFYSMEVVDGASLEEELRAGRRFNWREVTRIGIQICRALKHAHDHGVIHRDIKPANILIDRDEQVKIADFGIARLFGSTQLTNAGGILGTADFMSPEQADGRPVTHRCDQYSLGCVMYALLAGRPPFRASTLPEMLQLQRYAEAESVRRYAPHTPEALERTIKQLLAKSPDERFPNTLVLARHLEAMVRALSTPARDDFQIEENENGLAPSSDDATAHQLAVTQLDPSQGSASTNLSDSAMRQQETYFAGDSDADELAAEQQEQPEPKQDASRFTVVDDPLAPATSASAWSIAAPLLVVLAMIVAAVGGAYWMMQPRSADQLYAAIVAVPEESWESSDAMRDDLAEFLQRFPNDPRVAELRPRQQRAEASGLERRLRNAAMRSSAASDNFTAEEQLFVAILRIAKQDSSAARKQLEHLIALLAPATVAPQQADEQVLLHEQLLTLARRQLERLDELAEEQSSVHLPFAQSRLNEARRVAADSPATAAAICEALLATYQGELWAEALLRETTALRATLPANFPENTIPTEQESSL